MRELVLPNFFVIGAAKCGTTSLYELLGTHPDIFFPELKEPQFFSHDALFAEGVARYARHFEAGRGFAARGDATPHYLAFEKAATRIQALIPEEGHRFIAIFRDPVARAYSLYWNLVAEGVEPLSFPEALRREEERTADVELEQRGSLQFRYVSGGLYARQLRAFLPHFPRERFCLLFQEDLARDPAAILAKVCRFLGVANRSEAPAKRSNAAFQPRSAWLQRFVRRPHRIKEPLKYLLPEDVRRSITQRVLEWNRREVRYPPLDPSVDAWLRQRFQEDVLDLMAISGRDLSAWLPLGATGASAALSPRGVEVCAGEDERTADAELE